MVVVGFAYIAFPRPSGDRLRSQQGGGARATAQDGSRGENFSPATFLLLGLKCEQSSYKMRKLVFISFYFCFGKMIIHLI